MSKKKTKEKNIPLLYVIPALIMIVIIAGTLAKFGVQLLNDAKTQVMNSYENLAYSVSCQYEREVYAIEAVAKALSDYANDTDDLFDGELIKSLESVSRTMSIANAYIVKNDYSAIDINGNSYEMITELPGYENALKGTSTVSNFINNAAGQQVMLVCVPIYTTLEVKGYILFEYIPNVTDKLFQQVKFSSQNTYALVTADGKVVEASGAQSNVLKKGENVFDTAGNTFSLGSSTVFRQTVQVQRTDSFGVMKNGTVEYLYVTPVADYQAVVIVGVAEKFLASGLNKASENIRKMLISVAVIFGVFIVLIIVAAIFNKARFNMESEDLQNKADTDQLTDLYNKMATERLIREYLDGEGADKVSMLFLLDIDNFKKINDTMGHAFGDEVLMNLGHQIRSWFRVNDIVGRIGGDEFMVFIKDIKDENVIKREGSRIMQFFEGFQVGDYTKYSPTASVGGAVFPSDAKDFESLYKAADKAVYKAKKEGKNRVALFGDLNKAEKEAEPDKTGRD